MLKKRLGKVMGTFLAVSMFAISAEAAQINMIVDSGSGMFAEPEKVYETIDETVNSWFFPSEEELKSMTFSERRALKDASIVLIPCSESDAVVQIYREEKGMTVSYDDSMINGAQALDMGMTKQDLINLSEELGADYILYFRVTNSIPKMSIGFWTMKQTVNVVTDFRVWDAKQQQYSFIKRYQNKGKSSVVAGNDYDSRAVKKGLKKALEQITEDKDKIIAAIK